MHPNANSFVPPGGKQHANPAMPPGGAPPAGAGPGAMPGGMPAQGAYPTPHGGPAQQLHVVQPVPGKNVKKVSKKSLPVQRHVMK